MTNYRTLTWPSQATPIMVTVQLNDAKAFWTLRKYKLHTTDHTYVSFFKFLDPLVHHFNLHTTGRLVTT